MGFNFPRHLTDRFAKAIAKLLGPSPRVDAVKDSPNEIEARRDVLAIPSNVFFADASVKAEKGFHTARLAEQIARVAQLRCLDHYQVGELKKKFLQEEILPPRALGKLLVRTV